MNDVGCRHGYLNTDFRAKWVLDHEQLHNDLYIEEHFHKHYLKRTTKSLFYMWWEAEPCLKGDCLPLRLKHRLISFPDTGSYSFFPS